MTATRRHRFAPQGPCALEPRAFGLLFDAPEERQTLVLDGVAVVDVRGPLMHHKSWWCASYDDVVDGVREALEQGPSAVLLRIDSPGGVVGGLFEAAAALREACDAAGVPLHAYVDGQATSAAYALACVADTVFAPPAAVVGSIGVIDALVDARQQDAMYGVNVTLVASGARKTDGNPHAEATADAIAATQRNVDALARLFFAHVAGHRGLDPDAVAALQASTLIGAGALAAGLVDKLATFEETLAAIAGGALTLPDDEPVDDEETDMDPKDKKTAATTTTTSTADVPAGAAAGSKKYEEAIATLRKLASGDSDEAKKAKRMLKAELDDDGGDDSDDGDDGGDDGDEKDDADGQSAEAMRVARAAHALAESSERQRLLDTRPDLEDRVRADLATAPLATVRALVKSLPRSTRPRAVEAASTTTPGATRGASQGQGEYRQSPAAAATMRRAMGLDEVKRGAHFDGVKLILGGELPAEADPAAAK